MMALPRLECVACLYDEDSLTTVNEAVETGRPKDRSGNYI